MSVIFSFVFSFHGFFLLQILFFWFLDFHYHRYFTIVFFSVFYPTALFHPV